MWSEGIIQSVILTYTCLDHEAKICHSYKSTPEKRTGKIYHCSYTQDYVADIININMGQYLYTTT
jgi:hypothetical protein